jgi:hypothetical protein
MRTRVAAPFVLCLLLGAFAAPAQAQYNVPSPAIAESYRLEVMGGFWNPNPKIVISSEEFGIPGDLIDFVSDLGLEQSRFGQIKAVLRPGRKHKLRFEYTPINYEQVGTLTRSIVFNGQRYEVSVPVASSLKWNAYRFGYEFDFITRDRGFLGLVLEAKYTDVEARLQQNVFGLDEFVHAQAPIPAIGLIGRVYVMPNVSITGEFSGIKLPESINEDYRAKYYDFDLYGTVNFTKNVGAQLGYRSFVVYYRVEDDEGDLSLKGLYFGGVVRF